MLFHALLLRAARLFHQFPSAYLQNRKETYRRQDTGKAASTLLSAADKADNNTLSPIFLIQAGEILVKQGKYDDAVNAYTKIKDKYFQSYQAMDIDKYIEQAKLMKK